MTRTVGDQFFYVAAGPLGIAGSCLRRGDVKQGLEELSGESLVGSVQRAIDAVAETAGLPSHEVEQLLPTAEMDALLDEVATAQTAALEQWQLHMAHAGGLLEAVAKLTSDGRAPDAGQCLMRVATKMRLEKALAAPLRDLAGHVDRWQEMLEQLKKQLDEGKELEEARRRRQLVRVGIASVIGVAVLAVVAVGIAVMRSRGRVDALLARTNPCEIDLVADADLTMASGQQRASVAGRREACRVMREEAKVAEEKKQAAEAEKRRELEKKRDRDAACKELGARLEKPSPDALPPKLAGLLGKDEPFISALARGKLADDDVTRDLSTLTCMDSEAAVPIARAFAVALAKAVESWAPDHSPSPSALALLTKGKSAVSHAARENLIPPIEKVALDALVTGKVENTMKARRKCEVLTALEVKPHLYCQAVFKSAVK